MAAREMSSDEHAYHDSTDLPIVGRIACRIMRTARTMGYPIACGTQCMDRNCPPTFAKADSAVTWVAAKPSGQLLRSDLISGPLQGLRRASDPSRLLVFCQKMQILAGL